jgi:hypothetical protein
VWDPKLSWKPSNPNSITEISRKAKEKANSQVASPWLISLRKTSLVGGCLVWPLSRFSPKKLRGVRGSLTKRTRYWLFLFEASRPSTDIYPLSSENWSLRSVFIICICAHLVCTVSLLLWNHETCNVPSLEGDIYEWVPIKDLEDFPADPQHLPFRFFL